MRRSPMFNVDKEAVQYIKNRSGSVIIDLKLKPAAGGWCPNENVTGRYVPELSTREPLADELLRYKVIDKDGIKIYYSSRLRVRDGYSGIIIKLRKLLFFKWLTIDGAEIEESKR